MRVPACQQTVDRQVDNSGACQYDLYERANTTHVNRQYTERLYFQLFNVILSRPRRIGTQLRFAFHAVAPARGVPLEHPAPPSDVHDHRTAQPSGQGRPTV